MNNGLYIVMSPVQLAAVMSDKTVTEAETLQNRLLGGLDVAMSTVELAGATILCAAPDPTMLTKAPVSSLAPMDSIDFMHQLTKSSQAVIPVQRLTS